MSIVLPTKKVKAERVNPKRLVIYSMNGANAQAVNAAYVAYNDGFNNSLPQPSQLDLNGVTPSQYLNNLPQ